MTATHSIADLNLTASRNLKSPHRALRVEYDNPLHGAREESSLVTLGGKKEDIGGFAKIVVRQIEKRSGVLVEISHIVNLLTAAARQ